MDNLRRLPYSQLVTILLAVTARLAYRCLLTAADLQRIQRFVDRDRGKVRHRRAA